MPNQNGYFLLVDTNKNIMLIPTTNPELNIAIIKTGIDKVIKNETVGELLAKVKRYLRGESVTEETGDSDGTA